MKDKHMNKSRYKIQDNSRVKYTDVVQKNQLKEVGVRLVKENILYSENPLSIPENAVDKMKELLVEMDREVMLVLNLTTKSRVINYSKVSLGSINQTIISAREVFKVAILSNAAAIILMHNHPSGDVRPSHEDVEVTRKMMKAGKLLGIEVLDHIIIGAYTGKYLSFMTENMM